MKQQLNIPEVHLKELEAIIPSIRSFKQGTMIRIVPTDEEIEAEINSTVKRDREMLIDCDILPPESFTGAYAEEMKKDIAARVKEKRLNNFLWDGCIACFEDAPPGSEATKEQYMIVLSYEESSALFHVLVGQKNAFIYPAHLANMIKEVMTF